MTAAFSWPGQARLAMSFVVNVEEGSEQSIARGDKLPEPVDELGVALKIPIRNYGNESNYAYGLRAGAPRVTALFREFGFHCTVTAAATALAQSPHLIEWVQQDGHEVCCHGYRWVHQFSYKEDKERQFIQDAVRTITESTGQRPRGWLSRYLLTDNTRRLLAEEGFTYHMDDYSDDVPRWDSVATAHGPKPMVIVPYALDTNDMKFWLDPSFTPAMWTDYAVATFDQLHSEGASQPKMMSLGRHRRIIGRPGRIGALRKFMAYVKQQPDVWVATRGQIADHFASVSPFQASGLGAVV